MSPQNDSAQEFMGLFDGMDLTLLDMPDLYDDFFLRLDGPNDNMGKGGQISANVRPICSDSSSSNDIRPHRISVESAPDMSLLNEAVQLPSLKTLLSTETVVAAPSPPRIVTAIVVSNHQLPKKPTEWSTFADEQHRLEQQNHIVKSMSVMQLKAVAAAYSHVRWNDDFDLGCEMWMKRNPSATDGEIRAVKSLLNPLRWEHTQEIVASISLLVRQLHDDENRTKEFRKNQHIIVQRKRTRMLTTEIMAGGKVDGKRMRDSEN